MKQAVLIVSFGTSVPQAREDIFLVEQALAELVPQAELRRAYTSSIIRRILAGRGEAVPSLEEALEQLLAEGCADVLLQPTHLICGTEYDLIRETAAAYAGRFSRLRLGRALLTDHRDLMALAEAVTEAYLPPEGTLVLMGHGSAHFANMVYPAFQTVLRLKGMDRVYVATVEGWPTLEDVLAQMANAPRRAVTLAPLMLVAGDHALNDMAGNAPESWKSRLEAAGYPVACRLTGLGHLSGVRDLYRSHFRELLDTADGL